MCLAEEASEEILKGDRETVEYSPAPGLRRGGVER